VVAGAEESRVNVAYHILDGARFGDGRENIARLDTFDDTVLDFVFNACADVCATRSVNREIIKANRRGNTKHVGCGRRRRSERQYPVMNLVLIY